jgi:AsmA family protein
LNLSGWRSRASAWTSAAGRTLRDDWRRLRVEAGEMRRHRRTPLVVKWVASGFAVLTLALVLFFALFDWNYLRGPIGRYASDRLDREVRITGDLDVKIFTWTPRITADGITVRQPTWGPKGYMAQLQRLTVEVKLLPLLKGDVVLPLLAVEKPIVDLRRDASGRANWDFGKKKKKKEPTRIPPIQHFIINEGKLNFSDAKRDLHFTGTVSTSERSDRNSAAAFQMRGDGTINREPFSMRVTGGPLVNVRPDRPYPFNLEIRAGETRATARGSIPKPFDLGVFTLAMTLTGPDLADVYRLTTITMPNTPPYRLSGNVSRDDDIWRVRRMNGRVGDSDLGGSLTITTGRDRPHLEADLFSRSLDFDDLNTIIGGAPDPNETASPQQRAVAASMRARARLLPDAKLDLERVRAIDADVRYRANSVKARAVPLRQVYLDLDLERGVLTMNPLSFKFPQGDLSGVIRINGRGKVPVSDMDVKLRGVRLEQFIPARGGSQPLEGTLHARAKLHGVGASIHEAASNASGGVTLIVPRGTMRQAFAELLGINAGRGLMLLLSKDQRETPVRCAVADFGVSNGIMSARRIVIDTGVVLANGSGTISLRDETMNLLIDGETKRPRLLRLWSPITIQGPIRAPKPGVKVGSIVAQGGIAAALGAIINPIAALLPFVDPGLAKDADCGALIAQAGSRGAAATTTAARR